MADGTDPKRVVGRIVASMLLVGLGIGLISLLAWEWIDAVIIPDLGGSQVTVVGNYTPLAFLLIATLGAVVTAGVLGIFEGLRSSDMKSAAFVAAGCLIGAVLLVMATGVCVNFTGLETGESADITPLDLVSLAGLAGIISAPVGALTSLVGAK